MVNNKIICPFCGRDITNNYRNFQSIPQEETAHRDFSVGSTWLAVILKKRSIFENFMCSVARIAMKNMLNMMQ